nr:MAG TPA: endonuclease [Caudoviricetes sp.]
MITQSKYTKTFQSKDLTRQKYDELYDFAVLIRNHKNIVSRYVNENLLHYLDCTKFQFSKEMRAKFKGSVPSSFYEQIYTQVFTCYENKFKNIQHRLVFETPIFKGFELYKRDTKIHKKGDLKQVLIEKKQTKLSSCLTYLARYGNEGTIAYIKPNIDKCDANKRDFYNNIIRCCEKFGFERLYALALSKRKRILNKYANNPIEFRSLTFSGRCRKKRIIDYNRRFGSVINSFISLSGIGRKSFDIPVIFNKGWHGNMKDYIKNNPDYEYTLTFNEKKHQVNIHLCKDGKRYIPEPSGNTIGIDINCKHNLFCLSNETTYDYDRKLVNDFCKLSLEIDRLKEDRSYVIGKRKQRKLNKLKEKIIKNEQQTIATMCKNEKVKGTGHIVMENLNNGFGKCYIKDSNNEDINYNRKVKFLGLSSLKQEVEHIARKYDIAVSTVQASYTSKMCPICGCIEDGNRPTQETFECVECGHKDNADFNAAKNIRNRVFVTVLRDKLLKRLDNGAFEPRSLSRDKVKEVLLSFRRSLSKVGSECIGRCNTTL